jgi:ATP-dependent DNA helicase RecQ
VLDIDGVKGVGGSFHSNSLVDFAKFLYGSEYICGHNIFKHDLQYIHQALIDVGLDDPKIIDTLFLSPLLFPAKPYHKLLKDDKLQTEDTNNPLNDAIKAKDLFFDEIAAFQQTDDGLKQIFYQFLRDQKEFVSIFPTGGGKSITFQVPALMSGVSTKGLTVVISPLPVWA